MVGIKLNKYEYFYSLEVVGRGSETQLPVGEKLNYLAYSALRVNLWLFDPTA